MSQQTPRSDQYTEQDPKQQFSQPETQGKEIPAVGEPGSTEQQMDAKPDHGEESYRGSGRLTGKKALITGGDSGIGRAVAIAFAREGADVAIVHLPNEEEDARETASWVERAGRKAVAIPADIRDEQQCTQLVQRAVAQLHREVARLALDRRGAGHIRRGKADDNGGEKTKARARAGARLRPQSDISRAHHATTLPVRHP